MSANPSEKEQKKKNPNEIGHPPPPTNANEITPPPPC